MLTKQLTAFWSTLALSIAGAAAIHVAPRLVPTVAASSWWAETLRPACVTTSLLALTLAVVLTYSDSAEPQPSRVPASRISRGRALWAVATIAVVLLLTARST